MIRAVVFFPKKRAFALCAGIVALAALNASPLHARQAPEAVELLAHLRNADPVLCELANRALFNGWGSQPPPGGDAVAAGDAALIRWATSGLRLAFDPALVGGLNDADACVRRTSAQLLAATRDARARSALNGALRADDAGLAEAAAHAFGRARDTIASAPLIVALQRPEPRVQRAAAWALGQLEARNAVPPLIASLESPDAVLRATAATALGRIEDNTAVPALAALLRRDADPDVRRASAWALGQFK